MSDPKAGGDRLGAKLVSDFPDGLLAHAPVMTNYLSSGKTSERRFRQISCHAITKSMADDDKPYADIAERLIWHRNLEGLTQQQYAEKIGVKRATLNNWESGNYRLSLDGARALRRIYGLSLDFMIEGIDDALPMTLRRAWRERP
ncbi:helix-turn-helix transcriptional regulator [Tranquillimonas rosea]|uniref:helix-turn-helix transcriptional regulator n=1 Tax=Tranquillimonas rosea TaxID=641238 RepID=UPI003BACD8E3